MHVVQVTQRFPPALGGVENHVYNLALGLSAAGVSTEIFTTDLRTDTPFRRLDGGLPAAPFPVRRFVARKFLDLPHGLGVLAPSMVVALFEDSYELVHAHAYGYFPVLAGGLAQLIRRIPLVVTSHSDRGGESVSKQLFDWAVPPMTLRRAHRLIALTAREAQNLERLGVDSDRIRIIPNGVDLSEFENLAVRRGAEGEVTVLFVGRCYSRQKGLEYLVRAVEHLPSRQKVHLKIVGEDWGGVTGLRALARALGIEDQITFTGPLPRADVIRAYGSADIFVLPSLFEPFGIVLLEAMAAGLPIVASRVGGIPEVVQDGATGLLVRPGDSRVLAEAIGRLISDPSLRSQMGEAGRLRAAAFSWERLVPRILKVYDEAIMECG